MVKLPALILAFILATSLSVWADPSTQVCAQYATRAEAVQCSNTLHLYHISSSVVLTPDSSRYQVDVPLEQTARALVVIQALQQIAQPDKVIPDWGTHCGQL